MGRKSVDACRERDWLHIPFSGLRRKGNFWKTSKRPRPPRGDQLVRPLHHRYVQVFMDNIFTSVALLKELHTAGVYVCGTIRANARGLPVALLPKNLRSEKHQYRVAQDLELTFAVWQDTRPVLGLSNCHDPTAKGTVNRRTGNAEQVPVRVPRLFADYQRYMRGVDLSDQMIGWRRVFFHFMMGTALNTYIIAKDCNPEDVQAKWPALQDFVEDHLALFSLRTESNNPDATCELSP